MSASKNQAPTHEEILRGAIIGGVINGIINGIIQYFILRGDATLPLTVNGIINDEHTVFGAAVPLAVILAFILTIIANLTTKGPRKPFMPTGLWLTIKHSLFVFGSVVSLAVIWQRVMGSVSVSMLTAVVILGVVAAIVATVINYMSIKASMLPEA